MSKPKFDRSSDERSIFENIARFQSSKLHNDEFIQKLLSTKAFRRLQHVTFLGAIEYLQRSNGRALYRRRNNRLEHSLEVCNLVETYCRIKELTVREARPLLAAALLHDVGHGPLSHTLEPIFKAYFGLDHHSVGVSYVRGQGSIGQELERIFQTCHVDREQVIEIIEGKNSDTHSRLFRSTHNVDTIEAITRSISLARRSLAPRTAEYYFNALWLAENFSLPVGDEFWNLKNTVYHVLINGAAGRFMDSVAQSYMKVNIHAFSESDFMLTDRAFLRKFRGLHRILSNVLPFTRLHPELDERMLSASLVLTRRRFVVDRSNTEESGRYQQVKSDAEWYLSEFLTPVYEKSFIEQQLDLGVI